MARIPDEVIEEVKNRTDIVSLISYYSPLKKSGANYFTRCLFHTEKTASFAVNPRWQTYHCFGCGASGNVFTFLMQHERISFTEAVKVLQTRPEFI